MNFDELIANVKKYTLKCLVDNYANFSGRASRSEYWYYVLFIVAVRIAIALFFGVAMIIIGKGAANTLSNFFEGIFTLATIVPSIAVGVRRLHDINKSGWLTLIGLIPILGAIVLIVLASMKGTEGPNNFGEDPLQA
jgi:uncharacterized membrane protein YhaH (DUF805 family)